MSSSKKLKTSGSKRKVRVEEVEEVVTVDRRGRTKIIMQAIKQEQPNRKTPSPYKKPTTRKSLSPKAGGSKHSIPKPRLSKVCYPVYFHYFSF
jgi:hypothetical protein